LRVLRIATALKYLDGDIKKEHPHFRECPKD